MSKYKIVPINSKEEAIKHGKNRGWCTADNDGEKHYEHTYSKDKGDLFVVYEEGKKRPQYQLFISKTGSIEFRKKFNAVDNFDRFLSSDKKLKQWFEETYSEIIEKGLVGKRLENESIDFREYPQHTICQPPIIEITFRQFFSGGLIHVHNHSELPRDLDREKLYSVGDEILLIFSPIYNFKEFILISSSINTSCIQRSFEYDFRLVQKDHDLNILDFLRSLCERKFRWNIISQRGTRIPIYSNNF